MADNSNDSSARIPGPIGRVHELSWALFDENISANEMSELESLLLGDSIARDAYIECVQLHADLTTHYAKPQPATSSSPSKTQVLGFLNEAMPPLGVPNADKLQ